MARNKTAFPQIVAGKPASMQNRATVGLQGKAQFRTVCDGQTNALNSGVRADFDIWPPIQPITSGVNGFVNTNNP